MKDNQKSAAIIILMGLIVIVLWIVCLSLLPNGQTTVEKTTPSSNTPQIVRTYKVGDDVLPDIHQVYYYPEFDLYETHVIPGAGR